MRVVLVVLHRGRRLFEDPFELRTCAARADAAQRQRLLAHGVGREHGTVDHIPWSDCERDQISRQRLGLRKSERFPLCIRGYLFAARTRIGDRNFARRHRQRDIERCLEARLVESGKRIACADRFHLRRDIRIVADLDLVQALQLGVERCGVVESEFDILRRQQRTERHFDHAGFIAHREIGRVRLALGVDHLHFGNVELARMQEHMVRGLDELDLDTRLAGETLGVRIDLEIERVRQRLGIVRQLARRHRIRSVGGLRRGSQGQN